MPFTCGESYDIGQRVVISGVKYSGTSLSASSMPVVACGSVRCVWMQCGMRCQDFMYRIIAESNFNKKKRELKQKYTHLQMPRGVCILSKDGDEGVGVKRLECDVNAMR
jgi:hypothetical protein